MTARGARARQTEQAEGAVQTVRRSLDWLMLATVVLCCLGMIMAVSISGPKPDVGALLAMQDQGAKLGVGLMTFLLMAMFPLHLLWRFSGWFFWASTWY